MIMLTKTCPVMIKGTDQDGGLDEGQFTAIVSVFGNKDAYGDVVMPGAFTETLEEWDESGNPIPCYYSHRMDDPDYNIGHVLAAEEVDDGLRVKVQIDLEAGKGRQVYRLLKGRRLTQFSFAYDIVDGAWETEDGEEFRALRKLKLYEVGPTPIGANPATELLDVKSATDQALQYGAILSRTPDLIKSDDLDRLREMRDKFAAAALRLSGVMNAITAITADEVQNSDQSTPSAEPEKADHPSSATAPTDVDASRTGVEPGRLAALIDHRLGMRLTR